MAQHKTDDGLLMEAELATYGLPPRQPVAPHSGFGLFKALATLVREIL